jgi:hypothetical protein
MSEAQPVSKPKLKADSTYEHAHLVARDLLQRIGELLTERPAPDTDGIDWAAVGDIVHVNKLLSNVVGFLDGTLE